MKINEIENLYVGFNETENFGILILADDPIDAYNLTKKYGEDSGLKGDFEISEFFSVDASFDCDRIISASDFNEPEITSKDIEALETLFSDSTDESYPFTEEFGSALHSAINVLKALKSEGFTDDLLNMGYTKGIKDGRSAAIKEFVERFEKSYPSGGDTTTMNDVFHSRINKIASEMKMEELKKNEYKNLQWLQNQNA